VVALPGRHRAWSRPGNHGDVRAIAWGRRMYLTTGLGRGRTKVTVSPYQTGYQRLQ
jgi:hypothetical protein